MRTARIACYRGKRLNFQTLRAIEAKPKIFKFLTVKQAARAACHRVLLKSDYMDMIFSQAWFPSVMHDFCKNPI